MRPPRPAVPVGTFSFEGVEVQAFCEHGVWHLRSGGHEVTGDHLGEATQTLFNPHFHERTASLIAEILDWHDALEAPPSSAEESSR